MFHHQIKYRERSWNTTRSGVCLTKNVKVFHLVMSHCADAWYYFSTKMIFFYQKKLRMQKLAVFHLILNTYQTLISFVFSLWIIDEFEKKISNKLHRGACRNCIKTWKGSPELFQVSVHVQPCHLLNRRQKKKQFQCLNIPVVLNNKTRL